MGGRSYAKEKPVLLQRRILRLSIVIRGSYEVVV